MSFASALTVCSPVVVVGDAAHRDAAFDRKLAAGVQVFGRDVETKWFIAPWAEAPRRAPRP